ncbi:unnamed protein product [Ambrosiozyma monospora]|uniref:Unnamed protein product n=1 Tax=Ambrosiozyma monospora TaxID=43982 RepID=A0ACB5SUG9_AMBMO|nr:unnamed protein product [Ambrosiozyma monospora]
MVFFNPNYITATPPLTPLQGYFDFNAELNRTEQAARDARDRAQLENPDAILPPLPPPATRYTYEHFPEHYTWDRTLKQWRVRQRNARQFGRLVFVYPGSGERFYLRILLNVVEGAASFEDLRIVPGLNDDLAFPTFREACVARGLLDRETGYVEMFREALDFLSSKQLRYLFVCVLPELSEPEVVFEQFQGDVLDDLGRELQRVYQVQNPTDDDRLQFLYFKINDQLERIGKSNVMYNLPVSTIDWPARANHENFTGVRAEFFYSLPDTPAPVDRNIFNPEQLRAYDTIVSMVMDFDPAALPTPRLFLL